MLKSMGLALPWLVLPLAVALRVRRRPRLDRWPPCESEDAPLVSLIVPARNEEAAIGECLESLLRSAYPRFEVIVVDDGSDDATAAIVRTVAARDARVRLLDGEPLPRGWFGKPWACVQGASSARGELLLFTDADVVHEPELVGRTVAALRAEGASLLSVAPRQLLPTFWERLIMPQVLFLLLLRYPDPERVNASARTRDKIANGQFILVRAADYHALGGHGAVRHEVAEDLRLAQHFHANGRRVFLAVAERYMAVRMYRSLGGIVEGWSKNVAIASRQTVPAAVRAFTPWLLVLWLVGVWVLPPVVLPFALAGATGAGWLEWSGAAVGASLAMWCVILGQLGVPRRYAVLYPVGAAAAAAIFLKSALQGDRVRWKGRSYRASAPEMSRDRST